LDALGRFLDLATTYPLLGLPDSTTEATSGVSELWLDSPVSCFLDMQLSTCVCALFHVKALCLSDIQVTEAGAVCTLGRQFLGLLSKGRAKL
jgi:hypothetical protein